jgi:hypothetical protein
MPFFFTCEKVLPHSSLNICEQLFLELDFQRLESFCWISIPVLDRHGRAARCGASPRTVVVKPGL